MTEFERWLDSALRANQRMTFGPDQATLREWLTEAYQIGRREAVRPEPVARIHPRPAQREEAA